MAWHLVPALALLPQLLLQLPGQPAIRGSGCHQSPLQQDGGVRRQPPQAATRESSGCPRGQQLLPLVLPAAPAAELVPALQACLQSQLPAGAGGRHPPARRQRCMPRRAACPLPAQRLGGLAGS